jgi:hypothetical protein
LIFLIGVLDFDYSTAQGGFQAAFDSNSVSFIRKTGHFRKQPRFDRPCREHSRTAHRDC